VKRLARNSALSSKLSAGEIIIVEDFSFDSPKTKGYINILDSLKVNGEKTLLVTSDYEREVLLSCRNIPGSQVMRAIDLNTYDILKARKLILSEGAVSKIIETLN
jgi:large subunit ribosomal protein L4